MTNTDKETENNGRDSSGRFRKGNRISKGRPQGAVNQGLTMARNAAIAVALPQLIELAKIGDVRACEALLAHGLPRVRPVDALQPLELPAYEDRLSFRDGLLDLIRAGRLSIGDAEKLLDMVRDSADAEGQTIVIERSYGHKPRTIRDDEQARSGAGPDE